MTEPKLFPINSLLMAFLFAYSASVQLNDPDWYFWLPLYTFASAINLINFGRYKQSQEIQNIARLDLLLGIFLFMKVVIEDYVYELAGFSSMDFGQRVVREKTGSGLVVISMLLQLLSSSDQSTKGNTKKIKVVPRYVNYGMALLVILSYSIPLVFFVFLKGEIEDLRR
ncbi:hypothetical protein MKW98_001119 [Papaver atlanticum]|uniref:Transmembrane protein n=1 Tax=Papaver atlanticum TaxID=357466 RepID=A0AAD4SSK6_9MAGN|nr:hypothetical protein MKW98_001119 [Papaver atlanticum]